MDEDLAIELRPIVSEQEDCGGGDAAGEDVDDDEEGEACRRVVCQETEGVRERDPEPAQEENDESQGTPGVVTQKSFLLVQAEDEAEDDKGGDGVEEEVPDKVGDPEDGRVESCHQLDLLGVGCSLAERKDEEGGDEDGEAEGDGDAVAEGEEGGAAHGDTLELGLSKDLFNISHFS